MMKDLLWPFRIDYDIFSQHFKQIIQNFRIPKMLEWGSDKEISCRAI